MIPIETTVRPMRQGTVLAGGAGAVRPQQRRVSSEPSICQKIKSGLDHHEEFMKQ